MKSMHAVAIAVGVVNVAARAIQILLRHAADDPGDRCAAAGSGYEAIGSGDDDSRAACLIPRTRSMT